ncbi:FG-GAP-like repeat-containing protein [Streptomyces sp. H27-H1]|uniref:FG-GAP-like repeat-containing protein n=1 Tax=Streptomyces sp. H27-H1 TaxID=2996461 RepID=UPI00226EB075|nr:FG-GAP-like repeat-containing protein [Streptomyces sp. H27-H1]MCY0931431.1 FG-GAP-like repeat-containing protein [Streptomyces sp. H27-H1]
MTRPGSRSRSLRRALAAAVAAAASMAALVTAAPTAAAADNSARCPAGKFCVFAGDDFTGEMKTFSSPQATLGTWDNKISSLVNNSGLWATMHPDVNFSGDYIIVSPHNGPNDLSGSIMGRFDNVISSIRMATTNYEVTQGVPYMDWVAWPDQPRPAPVPAVAKFADLNNDRVADLLERADDGRLWFLPGKRDAQGRTQGKFLGGGWNVMTQLVRHGDYNSDGKEDIYARDKAGVLWFYPGLGTGAFGTRLSLGGGWNTMREISAAGDLTGDGRGDLLARDTAGVLWMYPGNGYGWFGTRKNLGGGWNTMNQLVSPGDLSGDGRADLLARDGSRRLWLYPGNGAGSFGARKQLPFAWPSDAPIVATGDATADGISDLLRPVGWSQAFVYPGTGTGGLRGPEANMSWDTAERVRVF